MEDLQHKDIAEGEQHVIHNLKFGTIGERDSYVPIEEDLYKVCLVLNPFGFFALSGINPTKWESMGASESSGSSGSGENQAQENIRSDRNPTTNINPTEKGILFINYTSSEIFVCNDNTTDKNIWIGNKGTKIEIQPEWIPPTKGTKIHQNFTNEAIKISNQEYKQFDMTIRTNTIQVDGFELYKAFDGLIDWSGGTWATSWSTTTTPLPNWIEIETKEKRLANKFRFMQPYNAQNCITNMTIQGSNDGINYTDIATMSPQITYNVFQEIAIQYPSYYKIYRVKIIEKYGTGVGAGAIEFIY